MLIAAKVAIDAHLWGAIGGLIFILLYWMSWRFTKQSTIS
jgi:membrane associated rhomboid family serine protease